MKTVKRSVSLLLVLVTVFSLFAAPVSAASISAYDCLSSSKYAKVYTLKASGQLTPYTGPDLKYRGTTSGRSSSAYIDCKADELWLMDVGVTNGKYWAKVSYPVARGARRIAYIPLSALTANTRSVKSVSTGKFLCSPRQGGSLSSSCYVAKNDVVTLLDVSGDWVQLLYPTGSNGYRIAWARKTDYEKYCGAGNQSVDVAGAVRNRLDAIANGSLRYNSSTVMKVGSRFTGTRSSEQCKGYAKNVFYMCFGITPGSTQSRSAGRNYLLNSTSGMTCLGSVTSMTKSKIAALFSKARPGDFVQMRRSHTGSHSAIVYAVSSTGVTFLEANLDNQNTVYLKTYTWADLCNRNAAMSVYTATNYALK